MKRKIPEWCLGAFKIAHRLSVRQYIDDEFAYKLLDKYETTGCEESKEALIYLSKFNNEYYRNYIDKDDSLHPFEMISDLYGKQNSINRDLMNKKGRSDIPAEELIAKTEKFNNEESDF